MEVQLLKGKHQDQAWYKNYVFAIKTKGKNATMFRCIFKGCHGSISLKVDNYTLVEPYRITNLNENHIDENHKMRSKNWIPREWTVENVVQKSVVQKECGSKKALFLSVCGTISTMKAKEQIIELKATT